MTDPLIKTDAEIKADLRAMLAEAARQWKRINLYAAVTGDEILKFHVGGAQNAFARITTKRTDNDPYH